MPSPHCVPRTESPLCAKNCTHIRPVRPSNPSLKQRGSPLRDSILGEFRALPKVAAEQVWTVASCVPHAEARPYFTG